MLNLRSWIKLPTPPPGLAPTSDRFKRLPWLFRDEGLYALEVLLDEFIHVPILDFRFGLDGIIGLIPGIGDIITTALTMIIPVAAWVRGARWPLLLRMLTNVAIYLVVGAIPFLGDAFDIYWKPNRRNYELLRRHIYEPHRHHARDWFFLLVLLTVVALLFVVPAVVTVLLFYWFAHSMQWM